MALQEGKPNTDFHPPFSVPFKGVCSTWSNLTTTCHHRFPQSPDLSEAINRDLASSPDLAIIWGMLLNFGADANRGKWKHLSAASATLLIISMVCGLTSIVWMRRLKYFMIANLIDTSLAIAAAALWTEMCVATGSSYDPNGSIIISSGVHVGFAFWALWANCWCKFVLLLIPWRAKFCVGGSSGGYGGSSTTTTSYSRYDGTRDRSQGAPEVPAYQKHRDEEAQAEKARQLGDDWEKERKANADRVGEELRQADKYRLKPGYQFP